MSYAHPEYLVDTEWVAKHLDDLNVRIIESDEDPLLYSIGHIPNSAQVDWFSTLQHPLRRDFLTKEQFEEVASKLGITNDTTVVFYGDKSNWFACYALWLFQYYGHNNVKIMNGGRIKWEQEKRPLVKNVPSFSRTAYSAKEADKSITIEALETIRANEEWVHRKSTLVYQPHWHKGVVGIVASRLIEHFYRPTIVLTRSGDYVAGSARSAWI